MPKKSKLSSLKRILALQMTFIGFLLQTLLFSWVWFQRYYPLVRLRLKFYRRGHLLVLLIYFVMLAFFTRTWEGNRVGDGKTFDVSVSQIFALFATDVMMYFIISLMRNWLVPMRFMWLLFAVQCAAAVLWIILSGRVYRRAFPPRTMLVVHGMRPSEDLLRKLEDRKDKYRVTGTIGIDRGLEAVEAEIEKDYGAVVLWDIPTQDRNALIKYCYGHRKRMYVCPKIPDVLMRGAVQIHLSDTPLYMTREYALTFGQRAGKRAIDLVCGVILLVLTSPIMLVTAIAIKAYDHGPVFYKQVRCTENMREFEIIKFRSMRVDAEKDGVARLASQHDSRITPVGSFIRKCRIDELPQLINVIRGDMSFIGPRPERPEIIAQYIEEMPEFAFRTRVKAGLAGYAQVYGKYNTTPYDKLKLDLTYIQNYSVRLDLKLMLLTLKILLQPESTEGVGQSQVTAMKSEEDWEPTAPGPEPELSTVQNPDSEENRKPII